MPAKTGEPLALTPVPALVVTDVAVPGGVYDGHPLLLCPLVLYAVLGADSARRGERKPVRGGSNGRSLLLCIDAYAFGVFMGNGLE